MAPTPTTDAVIILANLCVPINHLITFNIFITFPSGVVSIILLKGITYYILLKFC